MANRIDLRIKETIARANMLELAGIIHLASSRLQQIDPDLAALVTGPKLSSTRADGPEIAIYLAGCSGLKLRSALVGIPIYKIGTTTRRDVEGRIGDLCKVRYAGFDPATGGHHDGFDDYRLIPIRPTRNALPPGILLKNGCLSIRLPRDLSRSQFEARFRRALAAYSVSEWANAPNGRAHLSAREIHTVQLPVLTAFAKGAVRAKELYVLSLAAVTPIVAEAAAMICSGHS